MGEVKFYSKQEEATAMKLYRHGVYFFGALFILLMGALPQTADAASWVSSTPINLGDNFEDGDPASAEAVNLKFFALGMLLNDMRYCQGNDDKDIMVRVGTLCVDKYEASIYQLSDYNQEDNTVTVSPPDLSIFADFPKDGSSIKYAARSVAGVMPITNVTWFQAQAACAMAGKRLLTNAEWQMAAGGTDATKCQISGSPVETGSNQTCFSVWGVHDMAGNVSEWVADWMQGYRDQHKHTMKNDTETYGPENASSSPIWHSTPTFGEDGIYSINYAQPGTEAFPPAVIRGGEAGQNERAGIFAISASYGPGFSGSATGFRCARPLAVPPLNFNVTTP